MIDPYMAVALQTNVHHVTSRAETKKNLTLSFPFIPSVYIFRSGKLDDEQNFEIEVGDFGGKPFISMMQACWVRITVQAASGS